jgi:hypothetical protein
VTVRSELERLLRDTTLTTLAFAIALGWSLYKVAVSVGSLIALGLRHTEGSKPPLSAGWGDHIFYFEPLLLDLIVLVVVLAFVLGVQRRSRRSSPPK